MNNENLAKLLVPFGQSASIRVRDAGKTVRKRFLVSIHSVNDERVHEALFPGEHLEWENMRQFLANTRWSLNDWMHLLNLLHFENETMPRPHITEIIASVAAGVRAPHHALGKDMTPLESMQLCFAKAGILLTWDGLCKAMILCNLEDVNTNQALRLLLENTAGSISAAATRAMVAIDKKMDVVLSALLQQPRFDRDVYTLTFSRILHESVCKVAEHHVITSLNLYENNMASMKRSMKEQQIQSSRPSLTRIWEQMLMTAAATANNNAATHTTTTTTTTATTTHHHASHNNKNYELFKGSCALGMNVRERLKKVCYYFACLMTIPAFKEQALSAIAVAVEDDEMVVDAIQEFARDNIISFDIPVINSFIQDSTFVGKPLKILKLFKKHCFGDLTVGVLENWTLILQLYLVALLLPSSSSSSTTTSLREMWDRAIMWMMSTANNNKTIDAQLLSLSGDLEVSVLGFINTTTTSSAAAGCDHMMMQRELVMILLS
jgi:hypothetical protein